jgi:hypothetical protein
VRIKRRAHALREGNKVDLGILGVRIIESVARGGGGRVLIAYRGDKRSYSYNPADSFTVVD